MRTLLQHICPQFEQVLWYVHRSTQSGSCTKKQVPCARDADTLAWREQNNVESYLFRRLSPEKEASLRRHQHNGHIGTDKQVSQDTSGRPVCP